MNSTPVPQPSHQLMEGSSLFVGFFLAAIFAWSFAQGIVFQFAGGGITVYSPDNHSSFEVGESIAFSALFQRGTPPYTVRLYIAYERPPAGTPAVNVKTSVMSNRPVTYSWDTVGKESGLYEWQFIATDAHGVQYPTPVYSFNLRETTDEVTVETDNSSSDRVGSVSGGKGGHYSDRKGEKTGFFYTIFPGQMIQLSFANRTPIHRIRGLALTAIDELPGGNAFLIHQEFEPFFTSHSHAGYEEALADSEEGAAHPFFTALPTDTTPYKAIHIHLTDDTKWEGLSFNTAIDFEIPSEWLEGKGLSKENVVVQVYDPSTHTWEWRSVYWVKDEGDVHAYRVFLQGIPPFTIGASPESFYGARIVSVK